MGSITTWEESWGFVWMMWLFGNMVSGSRGTPTAALKVVDRDGGWLARAFVAELGGDEQIDVRELAPEEAATAENKVRTLYIPEGFTDGVLAGRQQTLRLEKDPDSNADFALAVEVRIIRTSVRTIARLIEMKQADELPHSPEDDDQAGERFTAIGEVEALVGLDVSTVGSGRQVPSGRAQSVPGILTMTVLMMTIIYGAVFLTVEKREGTLRRQLTLPLGRHRVFAGKLVGRLAMAGLQTVVLLLAGRFLYGISYGGSVLGLLLLVTSYCISVAGLATMHGRQGRSAGGGQGPDRRRAAGRASGLVY